MFTNRCRRVAATTLSAGAVQTLAQRVGVAMSAQLVAQCRPSATQTNRRRIGGKPKFGSERGQGDALDYYASQDVSEFRFELVEVREHARTTEITLLKCRS